MVRTARYVLIVAAAVVTIVGIGVTTYISWMTARVHTAKSDVDQIQQNTKLYAEQTQSTIAAQATEVKGLDDKFHALQQKAIEGLKEAAPDAVKGAVSVLLSPITTELQQLKRNLSTRRVNAREEDKSKFFISSAIADQNGSFNCIQGYYMIGLTFKNNNLPQILCRPLAELAP